MCYDCCMSRLSDIRNRSKWSDILEGQPQHAMIAALMTAGACALLISSEGSFWGLSATCWAQWSIALALAHQIIAAVVFRLQLHRNLMTRLFGQADMVVWGAVFFPLLIARPLTIIAVGMADTTPMFVEGTALQALGALLLIPAIWAMHSTAVYFTFPRALGGDHFRDHYAEMPLVQKGAFKYTSNAMYGVVFLGLWGIAFLFNSWNALIVALFQHAYIWVHMYCTENPDMRWIYRKS